MYDRTASLSHTLKHAETSTDQQSDIHFLRRIFWMKHSACFLIIAFVVLVLFNSNTTAQQKDRAQIKKEIDALNQQIRQRETELLAPSQEDQTKFAEFLKQPDTGLIRLMPRERYDRKLTISGGGAYYSFFLRTHEYGRGSDISLEQNYFSVGFAGADFGFLFNLGDMPIEDVTTETNGVKYLVEFVTPSTEPQARIQQRRAWEFEEDGFKYQRRVLAKVGNTYVVRSVNYGDSDWLVAFRSIDEDFDGSITIAWKVLKKFPKPELARIE